MNPAHMWQRPARWMWALATDESQIDTEGFPNLLKLDTQTGSQRTWAPPGLRGMPMGLGGPSFVPAAQDQAADSDAGSLLVLAAEDAAPPVLFVIDAATLKEVARLELPISPMPSIGLHNHFSDFPSSV